MQYAKEKKRWKRHMKDYSQLISLIYAGHINKKRLII